MHMRRKTVWILVVVSVGLIVWDLYAMRHPQDTISRVILSASHHPILPFSFGVLMGHLFWAQRVKDGS